MRVTRAHRICIHELTATVATGWNLTNGSTVAELNDGIHGAFPEGTPRGHGRMKVPLLNTT